MNAYLISELVICHVVDVCVCVCDLSLGTSSGLNTLIVLSMLIKRGCWSHSHLSYPFTRSIYHTILIPNTHHMLF